MKFLVISLLTTMVMAKSSGPDIPSCASDCVNALFPAAKCDVGDWACLCKESMTLRTGIQPCAQGCTASATDANNVIELASTECQNASGASGPGNNTEGTASASGTATTGSSGSTASSTGSAAAASSSTHSAANTIVGQGMGFMILVAMVVAMTA